MSGGLAGEILIWRRGGGDGGQEKEEEEEEEEEVMVGTAGGFSKSDCQPRAEDPSSLTDFSGMGHIILSHTVESASCDNIIVTYRWVICCNWSSS